jgi:hypothetical protein
MQYINEFITKTAIQSAKRIKILSMMASIDLSKLPKDSVLMVDHSLSSFEDGKAETAYFAGDFNNYSGIKVYSNGRTSESFKDIEYKKFFLLKLDYTAAIS